jgi:hypothetical protein
MSRGRESRPTRAPEVRIGARMPKFSFVLDVRDPPEKVIGAMIDFSDRRPEIWPSLSAKIYRAHSVGKNTADVTGKTDFPGGGVWERVTYEWTDTAVKSVITDSKLFQAGGTFEFRVEPHGSGSRIHFSIDRKGKKFMGRLVGALMRVSDGAPMKKSCMRYTASRPEPRGCEASSPSCRQERSRVYAV